MLLGVMLCPVDANNFPPVNYTWDNILVKDIAIDGVGNIYLIGNSRDSNITIIFSDIVIVKYDREGKKLWQQRYNSPGADNAQAVAVDYLGNVYVTGWLQPGISRNRKFATIKYDANGKQQWVACYKEFGWTAVIGSTRIAIDSTRNAYIAGHGVIIKYDTDGKQLWTVQNKDERYGRWAPFMPYNIAVDHADNIYVTGTTKGNDRLNDYTTAKYDPNGRRLWIAQCEGEGEVSNNALALTVDKQANVYVTGWSTNWDDYCAIVTIKYDANGKQQWLARYDGGVPCSIALDQTGSVYIAGHTITGMGIVTVKYDTNGKQQWVAKHTGRVICSGGWNTNKSFDLILDGMGNVYVQGLILDNRPASEDLSGVLIVKYDANGNEKWTRRFNHVSEMAKILNEIRIEVVP